MNLNDYEWHDAILKNICIDRENLLSNDANNLVLSIVWADGSPAKVVFSGVYEAILDLKFRMAGLDGTETIYTVSVLDDDDPDFVELGKKWQTLNLDVANLNRYYIETATSVSKIKIFAKQMRVINE